MTSLCMCQNIEGPLRNWTKRDWNHNAKAWTFADGNTPTGEQLKDFFLKMHGKGYRVLPIGKCDNFDKQKGCRGHNVKECLNHQVTGKICVKCASLAKGGEIK